MVSLREREGLIARIRQIRRTQEASGEPPTAGSGSPEGDAIHALEARITHLEQRLQGLQDSVHREATRQTKRIADELGTEAAGGHLGKLGGVLGGLFGIGNKA